jgi:DNA-binding Xre family transcriptional regulator
VGCKRHDRVGPIFKVALEQRRGAARLLSSRANEPWLQAAGSEGEAQSPMPTIADGQLFFSRLGKRIREVRQKHGHSQEDMISYGFSARHWQQIEAGRPITVATLLRICAALETPVERMVRGLDKGIYRRSGPR